MESSFALEQSVGTENSGGGSGSSSGSGRQVWGDLGIEALREGNHQVRLYFVPYFECIAS